jgi:hypothetical protein
MKTQTPEKVSEMALMQFPDQIDFDTFTAVFHRQCTNRLPQAEYRITCITVSFWEEPTAVGEQLNVACR